MSTAVNHREGAIYPQRSEDPDIMEYAIDLRSGVTHCRLVVNDDTEILVSASEDGTQVMVLSPGHIKHRVAEPSLMGEYVRVSAIRIEPAEFAPTKGSTANSWGA